MKKLSFLKMVCYLALCALLANTTATLEAEQLEQFDPAEESGEENRTVSSYKLMDKKYGPVGGGKFYFGQYFIIEGGEIGNKDGYIDIAAKNSQGHIIVRNRFQWEFSRNVDYLFPDPNNNLTVRLAVGGAKTRHTMQAHGKEIANELMDNTKWDPTDTYAIPKESADPETVWKTFEYHVGPIAYGEHTAIGIRISVKSPVNDIIEAHYAIAYVYQDSAKTPNGGDVTAAQVTSLWPVYNATCGGIATLWALIDNTGNTALPSGAGVWFYVRGPYMDDYVGSAPVESLKAGHGTWGYYNWAIPYNATGTYTYWAIVWSPTLGFISPWSQDQNFTVGCQ